MLGTHLGTHGITKKRVNSPMVALKNRVNSRMVWQHVNVLVTLKKTSQLPFFPVPWSGNVTWSENNEKSGQLLFYCLCLATLKSSVIKDP